MGDAVIKPSLTTGLEFHSNVYQAEGEYEILTSTGEVVQGTPEVPALMWYLRPRVNVALEGPKLKLDLDGGYGLKKYIDLDPDDEAYVQNLDRFSDFDANLGVDAWQSGKVGVRLRNRFNYGGTVTELESETESGSANVIHLREDFLGGIPLRPGSAIEIYPKGHFGFDDYSLPSLLVGGQDAESGLPTYFNNRLTYGPQLEGTWKFLPKTSFLLSGGVDWLAWDRHILENVGPEIEGSDAGAVIGKADSVAWKAKLGLRGQVTQKIALVGFLGYGQAYYDEQTVLDDASNSNIQSSSSEIGFVADGTGEDFARDLTDFTEGLLVDLQVGYAPLSTQKITAGYRKDFADSVFSNYSLYNYWYFRYTGTLVEKVGLGAEVGYRIDAYHGEINRDDQSIVLKASGAYSFTKWMSTGLQVSWNRRACLDSKCENDQYYTIQYDDFAGQLGLTLRY